MRIVILFVVIILSGCGPKDYDDCILKNMKDAKDETAAKMIANSCFEKYYKSEPVKKCQSRELLPSEISKVQVRGGPGYKTIFSLSIYNGNENVTLQEITIAITGSNYQSPQVYKTDTFVDALSANSDVSVHTAYNPTGKVGFQILSIKGCVK